MTKPIRQIRGEGNIAYVPLTKGYEAIIDADDVPLVAGRNWQALVKRRRDGIIWTVYAVRTDFCDGKKRMRHMHRMISRTPENMQTDHIDGNGLNNLRSNLRNATNAQNQHNKRINKNSTSGVKGVCWDSCKGKWKAQIRLGNKRHNLGNYKTLKAASAAYAMASTNLHGEFGRTD